MTDFKAQFNYNERAPLHLLSPLASPLVIYIEPSSFCNLECLFCPQHIAKGQFTKHNMTCEVFEKVLCDLKNFESKPKLMRFCGIGDPLFNKDISQIIEMADRSNSVERTELITNGLLLTEKVIAAIAHNVDRVIFSIEGLSDEDYLKFTKRRINFDKLIRNIQDLFFTKNRKCKIHVKIHNQAVKSDDRRQLFFNLFESISDEIYIENLVDLWPELKSNLGDDSGHRFDSGTTPNSIVCPQIFKSMQVNADGRVQPCCVDWKALNIIGDVNAEDLSTIWTNRPMRRLQKLHLEGKRHTFSPCSGCVHNEYSEKDNLDAQAPAILERIKGMESKSDVRYPYQQ